MKKRVKSKGIAIVIFLAIILVVPLISAGFFQDAWNKITGKASSTATVSVSINVNAAPPVIYNITNVSTAITLTDAPNPTYVIINFSVNDTAGASNLNNATAMVNLTKANQPIRMNSSCAVKDWSGTYANYTCNITMWWWDAAGVDWTIYANITDLNSNNVVFGGNKLTVNTLTGFAMSPSSLTFSTLAAGATNQTPTNYLTLNNTGNANTTAIQINATDLVGETTKSQFLWASNFSASNQTGGNIECNITASATSMVNGTYTSVVNAALIAGNYTKNDGTAQETMYLCLRKVGAELTQQAYSTNQYGTWTVKFT